MQNNKLKTLSKELDDSQEFPFLYYLMEQEKVDKEVTNIVPRGGTMKSTFYNVDKTVIYRYHKPISKIY